MALKSFKIEKLIRDRLPDMLRAEGVVVHDRVLGQEEYVHKLKEKLLEEAEEVKRSRNADELAEELADILEVIQALTQATGLTLQEIEGKRKAKREKKGGFEGKVYCHRVDLEENNPAIAYYLNQPTQYPATSNQTHDPECLFCRMAQGEQGAPPFARFRHCYAIKDQHPVSPGHVLIIPYEHTNNWFTASEEVRLDMVKALNFVKELLEGEYHPQGYNIGANCGETAGQTVMHLHVHLIPRYQGDMVDPKGGVRGVIPSKQKY